MTTATAKLQAILPYPTGINLRVYRDDGQWSNYRAWFMRADWQLSDLHVATITLAHYEEDEAPAYTYEEWCDKANRLIAEYPDCVFIYV